MSQRVARCGGEHQGAIVHLRVVMDVDAGDLTPTEIARLFEVASRERQMIAEMEACWQQLRSSHPARERREHLSPSEVHDAIAWATAGLEHLVAKDGS